MRMNQSLTAALLALFLGFLLAGAAKDLRAQPEAPAAKPAKQAAPKLVLHALKFTGARTIPAKKLRAELTIPLPSLLPWKKAPAFTRGDLDNDIERLKDFYRRQGFYHAAITPEIKKTDSKVDVTLVIDEGPWVKVTQMDLDIPPEAPKELLPLKPQSPLKVGNRFNVDDYEGVKRLFLDYLFDHGYPRAKVEGQILLDEEKNTAKIDLKIRPGPLCHFGDIKITGPPDVPEYLIRRKLTFKPEGVYSLKDLYDSQRKLYALDLFKSVTLTPQEVPAAQTKIPITVVLEEKKKRSLKAGVGYGDEDQFRGRLGLRFRNLGGGGRMLDLDAKYSRLETRGESTFTNPQIFASQYDFVAQAGIIRRYLPAFTDKAYFTQERLERDLPWKFRLYFGHGLEFARPFNIPEETLAILTNTQTGKLYRASMGIIGVRQDTTDNPIDPHRGGLLSLGQEVSPSFFGSNLQFHRTLFEARRYQSLGKSDFILAGRLKFGIIEPMESTQDIPIFRRFFAGGYNSVRGYRLDYLGPRNPSGSPLGGNALMEGSIETRIPIYKEFRAVAFLDFGNVFFKAEDIDVGQLKYASGFGLRYQTFIGPIGVDFAWPLNPIDRKRDDFQVHFTIGQAF